jgi:hypothetical protein
MAPVVSVPAAADMDSVYDAHAAAFGSCSSSSSSSARGLALPPVVAIWPALPTIAGSPAPAAAAAPTITSSPTPASPSVLPQKRLGDAPPDEGGDTDPEEYA